MNYLVLLGIAIVIVGFALKLDSILIIALYGLMRVVFAAFNVSFCGVAGFVRPVIMPMAIGAIEAAIEAIVTCKEDIKGNLGTTH